MIQFRAAACLPRLDACLAFGPTDLELPADRSIAVLGGHSEARTELLHLIARRSRPDRGAILHRCRVSPILNDERLLHPALTTLANLRFVARAHGIDEAGLLRAVDAFARLVRPADPVRSLEGGSRRILEAAIVAALPYDLILLDGAQQFPLPILGRLRDAARHRGAGFIFASAGPRPARSVADLALVLDGDHLTIETDPHRAASRLEQAAA